jgi:hypothetical protein
MIQEREEVLMKGFETKLANFGKDHNQDERDRQQFLSEIEEVRAKRKQYKGLLWDALEQRNNFVKSFDIQQNAEREKERQVAVRL